MTRHLICATLFLMFCFYAAPLPAQHSLAYDGKISAGGVEQVGFIAFSINAQDGTIAEAYSNETALTDQADQALELAPLWVRADLRDSFSRLSAADQDAAAGLILGIEDPRIIDEVAFMFAHNGPEMLGASRNYFDVIVLSAQWIYLVDEDLDYVEIIDEGDPAVDDDFSTTTRYTVRDDGEETTYTLPAEIYYWYIVQPILDCQETIRKIWPPSGFPSVDGEWWRQFYYEDNEELHYTRPHVLVYPNDITTFSLSSSDFDGPAAYSVFTGPERSYSSVVREIATRAPVFISFVHGEGRVNANYPNPDGHVFAVTMPLEIAAASGDNELLKNMLLAGQGNRPLREDILMSESLGDVEGRKILILRDRMPFDRDSDPNEDILDANDWDYDVLGSDALADLELTTTEAPFVPLEYIKIVVPSDQPLALYQALSDNAEKIETYVDNSGFFQFHGAVREEDDWTGLDMPFGIKAEAMDHGAATSDIEIMGFPLLKEVIEGTTYLWDRADAGTALSGERAYDPDEGALSKIGWWVSNNLPWRVAEMMLWRRNPSLQRGWDPVRLVYNHYGNCGELQDVLGAAARTLLIPCALTATHADDHVWNEFYDNDMWYPYQISWSGSSVHLSQWTVGADADVGGGKTISGMVATRPDCLIRNILGSYETVVNEDGIIEFGDYSFYVTLRATVVDKNGVPVDGARVFVATQSFYDPMGLSYATEATTGPDGVAEFTVGENNAYYYRVDSVFGSLPDPDHVDFWVGEEDTAEPGAVIEKTFQFTGLAPDGLPYRPIPAFGVSETSYNPPEPDEEALSLSIEVAAGRELAYGRNMIMDEMSWTEPLGQGLVDVYLLSADNYNAMIEGYAARAIHLEQETEGANFDIDLSKDSGTWYLVISNPFRVVNAKEVTVSIGTEPRTEPEAPAEDVEEDIPEGAAEGEEDAGADADADAGEDDGGGGGCGCAITQ